MTKEEVYKTHFVPNSRLIKANDPYKRTAREIFKSNKHLFISGSIAVIEDNAVLWATGGSSGIIFLENVLYDSRTIDSLKSKVAAGEDIHTRLFNLMREKNLPDPGIKEKKCFREIAIGFRRVGISEYEIPVEYDKDLAEYGLVDKKSYRRYLRVILSNRYSISQTLPIIFADFVVLSDGFWIIEGKEKLNYEAIGQVLVYKDLLEEDYPQLGRLRMGIACFEGDMRFELTCKRYGIEVFKLGSALIGKRRAQVLLP